MKTPEDNPAAAAFPAGVKARPAGTLEAQGVLADFMEAFMRASGLPLELAGGKGTGALCPGMAVPGFCQLIHESHSPRLREMCGLFGRHLEEMAVDHPHQSRCFAGIEMAAVPLRDHQGRAGCFKTGHVLLKQPVARDFHEVMRLLSAAGMECVARKVEKAWFALPVMEPARYHAFLDLLAAFARKSSGMNPESGEEHGGPDSHALREAQRYIEKNSAKRLTLSEVADAVGLSPSYFCRKFRGFSGLSFTDYLAGVRVQSAARLLHDPKKRVSEIAYAAGFNSISQFNRVFRVTMGVSPSDYRRRMLPRSSPLPAPWAPAQPLP